MIRRKIMGLRVIIAVSFVFSIGLNVYAIENRDLAKRAIVRVWEKNGFGVDPSVTVLKANIDVYKPPRNPDENDLFIFYSLIVQTGYALHKYNKADTNYIIQVNLGGELYTDNSLKMFRNSR